MDKIPSEKEKKKKKKRKKEKRKKTSSILNFFELKKFSN